MQTASQPSLPLQEMLGYLNFSSGKPDPRFHKQINDTVQALGGWNAGDVWAVMNDRLRERLDQLHHEGSPAFRDISQATAVLNIAIPRVLPAYRSHHFDLLGHQPDAFLFQPFFLARVFEAVLAQSGPWDEADRIVAGAVDKLNDYVGYRPIPVLETKPEGEPYDGEWFRPIPIYLRGIGASSGPYQSLIARTMELLAKTQPSMLRDAYLDLNLVDEVAVDPRGFDPAHPAYRRPNHMYGEWDPHHLDNQGRYRRYVVRKITLDAITARLELPSEFPKEERETEAVALLAGTILMASAICGESPTTHDSSVTLGKLLPKVARHRDAFYTDLLQRMASGHQKRLKEEAERSKQPFGAARQHFNQYMTRQRAAQLQARHLAVLFANMGFPEAAREIAEPMEPASVRFLCRIVADLTTAQRLTIAGKLAEAAAVLPEVEDRLKRGIDIGAFVDPWNILGFQARFPLFHSIEDAVHDWRIDELVHIVERTMSLGSRLVSAAGATGDRALQSRVARDMRRIGDWWDQFGTLDVSDILHVNGEEMTASAEHVGKALHTWHQRGDTPADIAFWRDHVTGFGSPKAFTLVIDELMRRKDYKASMALLMYWLSQSAEIDLEDPDHSFHLLALRWMHEMLSGDGETSGKERLAMAARFLTHMEANAEELWKVPRLEKNELAAAANEEDEDNPFAAAYEGMSYKDSTRDGHEGSVLDGGPVDGDFSLEADGEDLEERLRFLAGVARLWRMIAEEAKSKDKESQERFREWLGVAERNLAELRRFLAEIHQIPVPDPLGSEESVIEFEKRRSVKEQLLEAGIATCLETHLTVRSLSVAAKTRKSPSRGKREGSWEDSVYAVEAALKAQDGEAIRPALARFVRQFHEEPLLYIPLEAGGDPQLILQTRIAQYTLRKLMTDLPKAGLLRETYHLVRLALEMEMASALVGRRVTEFDRLFGVAVEAVTEALVDSAPQWRTESTIDEALANVLGSIARPFLALWIRHSQSLRLSALEVVRSPEEWEELRKFVQTYGGDLFHVRFLTLANLRGILHHGVGAYLDQLQAEPDPMQPIRLIDELDAGITREQAVHWLEVVLQTISDQYEEYKDYNTSTAHSDYGQNLHVLLDFLRLKSSYDRYGWQFRPVAIVHNVLVGQGRTEAATLWQSGFARLSREVVESHLKELDRLERTHGLRLVTIADRLKERFIRPLEIDRLCGLIEPAIREAGQTASPAFARFREALQPFVESPAGSGLDVPHWIRRCETEAQKVLTAERFPERDLAPASLPQTVVSVEELQRDLPNWEKPLWEALE